MAKIKNIIISLILMLVFSGCVEEPTIPEVNRPFTMWRLGNLIENVESIDIYVDDVRMVQNLNKKSFTDYIEIVSGRREIKVRMAGTDSLLFEKKIDAISYEEQSIYWAGYYSPDIDINTMGLFTRSEGVVYNVESPDSNRANLFIFHASPDTPTDSTRNMDLLASYTPPGDTVQIDSVFTENQTVITAGGIAETVVQLKYGEVNSFMVDAINYDFQILYQDPDGNLTDSVFTTISYEFKADMRYYMYITGPSSNVEATIQETIPPAALGKDK